MTSAYARIRGCVEGIGSRLTGSTTSEHITTSECPDVAPPSSARSTRRPSSAYVSIRQHTSAYVSIREDQRRMAESAPPDITTPSSCECAIASTDPLH
jgi:hypothetical protein